MHLFVVHDVSIKKSASTDTTFFSPSIYVFIYSSWDQYDEFPSFFGASSGDIRKQN